MTVFMAAAGLVLVFEGVLYAVAPAAVKRMAARMQEVPDDTLRMGGLGALAAGVAVVWVARSVLTGS
jgi:uncharacterized protein